MPEKKPRLTYPSRQPRLHPQSRSDPQIRAQYLPSVLSGEEPGYRIHKSECSPFPRPYGAMDDEDGTGVD